MLDLCECVMMSYEINDLFTFDSGTRQKSSERVTPFKVSIMALVYEYTHLCRMTPSDDSFDEANVMSEKDKRVFMVTLLNLLQGPDMDLRTLRSHVDPIIKPALVDALYDVLRAISDVGVKTINDFFENNSRLLESTGVDKLGIIQRESVMGLYIRRMELAYNEMSFSQLVDTYKKVRRYYEAGFPEEWEEEKAPRHAGNPHGLSKPALTMSHLNEKNALEVLSGRSYFSRKQAEHFIANQALMLSHNEIKALPPDQMQQKLTSILSTNPDLAEAHFLSYMNSLRLSEYCTALHSLYHYFDRKACAPNDGASSKKKGGGGGGDEVAMRYAALNLASLQYRFGNIEECKVALRESIRLAQESNDQVCLQHALVWLTLADGDKTAVTQIERSIRKTIDLSLPNLTVLGLSSLSRRLGQNCETPAGVIFYFTQSNLINCMNSNYSRMSSGSAQRAATWAFYGNRELSCLDSQIVLHLNTSINGHYYSGQSVCIALCNMAQHHADLGQYACATELLNMAKLRFPVNTEHAVLWQSCQQRILFTQAILGARPSEAQQILINLQAVDEPEARIRKAILLKEQGQVVNAFSCLDQLLMECDSTASGYLAHYRCRVVLELAGLYIATGNHASAIVHITDCTAHAKRFHLQVYEALATAYLAFVQLHMGLPEQAILLVESQLVRLLTNATAYDKGRVLYVYARCKVAAANKLKIEADRKAELVSALDLMSTVIALFKSVDAHRCEKDAYYYQAVLYHLLGDTSGRNRCAHQFKLLDKLYPTLSSLCVNMI